MWGQYWGENAMPAFFFGMMAFLPIIIAWAVIWKGWALWVAARAGSKPWFIALLIINTMGLLEIIYIFWFSKSKIENQPKP